MRFEAILMDFYGTVCAGDHEAVDKACRRIVEAFELPMTAADLAIRWGERFFSVIDRSNHDVFRTLYECELLSLKETLVPLVGAFDPAPFVADLEAYWMSPAVHADAVEFLETVDVPVCCVSNADTAALLAAIGKHGLRFDAVISSEMARCYKPQAGIFHHAVDRLGVNPRQVLHVGDSLHSDVSGAAKLGIRTAWLCRETRIHDIGCCEADHTITSLAELPDLLR